MHLDQTVDGGAPTWHEGVAMVISQGQRRPGLSAVAARGRVRGGEARQLPRTLTCSVDVWRRPWYFADTFGTNGWRVGPKADVVDC